MSFVHYDFAMNPATKDRLEMVAGPRGLNLLLRKITDDWVDEHYPDRSAIMAKIGSLEQEIKRLNIYLGTISGIEATQDMDAMARKQFLDNQKDGVVNMLYTTYISKTADNKNYNLWNNMLEFDSIPELKKYLKAKWEEYGRIELLKMHYKNNFKSRKMKEFGVSANKMGISLKEYLELYPVDLENQFENGLEEGALCYFEEYLDKKGLR